MCRGAIELTVVSHPKFKDLFLLYQFFNGGFEELKRRFTYMCITMACKAANFIRQIRFSFFKE